MRVYRSNPEFTPVVSVADMRMNSRIDGEEENTLLLGLLMAAQDRAEQETGIAFGEDEWIIEADPCGDVIVPIWPVTSVESVTAGTDPFTDYEIVRSPRRLVALRSGSWPDAVSIRVLAGMPAPPVIRQAILMIAGHWYDNRAASSSESVREVPYAATALLSLSRRVFA